jgi:hypothetical protein
MLFWPLLKELHETNSMDDIVFVSRAQYAVRIYVKDYKILTKEQNSI